MMQPTPARFTRPGTSWRIVAALVGAYSCLGVIAGVLPGPGTASYPGGLFREDFSTLAGQTNLVPAGWYVANLTQGGTTTNYVNLSRQLAIGTGATPPAGLPPGWNLGTSETNADRSLGTGATGTGAPGGGQARAITLQLRNDSPAEIAAFSIFYDGEQWRTGSSGSPTNQLQLQLSRDGLDWVNLNTLSPGTEFNFATPLHSPASTPINGKLPGHRRSGIGGLVPLDNTIEPGEVFYLRWFDYNEAGVDPVMAVDNVLFFAGNNVFELARPSPQENLIEGEPLILQVLASPDVSAVVYVVDGTPVGTNNQPPFEWAVTGLARGEHTVVAEGTSATGGVSAGPITVTIRANQSPVIQWVMPPLDLCVLAGTPITNTIFASDPDGTVAQVVWSLDGEAVFTNAGSSFIHESSRPGRHIVTAMAVDDRGATASTEPSTFTVVAPAPTIYTLLVTNGTSWRYWNQSMAPAPDGEANHWFYPGYDDSAWPSGNAPLGNGDEGEGRPRRTALDIGPGLQRVPTLYFRTEFAASETTLLTNLLFQLLVDDGAAVYLNGHEIHRENLPSGILTHETLAENQAGDGRFFRTVSLDLLHGTLGSLLESQNTLAVEVHQAGTTSSDLTFDLMLWGETTRTQPVRHLTLSPAGPGAAVLRWDPYASPGHQLEATDFLGWDPQSTTWVPVAGCPGEVNIDLSGGFRAFRLARRGE